jgi:predicted  nucleic acid-binding Zn-ribbon protein
MSNQKHSEHSRNNSKVKILNPNDLADLALDIWRLQNRINKLKDKLDNESFKPIEYFFESCKRNLSNIGFEIKDDYTGEEYKGSMNVDVVAYESMKMDSKEAKVKETLEPAILFDNQLIRKAKVIIVTPKV